MQSQREGHLLTACQTAGHIPFYLAPYPANMSHPFFSSCRCNELWEDPVHLPGSSPAPGGFPLHSEMVSQLVCCPSLLLVWSWIFWGCSLSCSHCFFQFTGFFLFLVDSSDTHNQSKARMEVQGELLGTRWFGKSPSFPVWTCYKWDPK